MLFCVSNSVSDLGVLRDWWRGPPDAQVQLCRHGRQHLCVWRCTEPDSNWQPHGLQHWCWKYEDDPDSRLRSEFWLFALFQCLSSGLQLKPVDPLLRPWSLRILLWAGIRSSCLEVLEQEENSVKTFMFLIQVNTHLTNCERLGIVAITSPKKAVSNGSTSPKILVLVLLLPWFCCVHRHCINYVRGHIHKRGHKYSPDVKVVVK